MRWSSPLNTQQGKWLCDIFWFGCKFCLMWCQTAEVCRVFWQMACLCAWTADGWKPDTWGITSPGTPGSPEGSQLRWELWALGWHCWLIPPAGRGCHYSPSPLLSAPFCSLFGGGSVAELVMEWLKTSFSEGCNTNWWRWIRINVHINIHAVNFILMSRALTHGIIGRRTKPCQLDSKI